MVLDYHLHIYCSTITFFSFFWQSNMVLRYNLYIIKYTGLKHSFPLILTVSYMCVTTTQSIASISIISDSFLVLPSGQLTSHLHPWQNCCFYYHIAILPILGFHINLCVFCCVWLPWLSTKFFNPFGPLQYQKFVPFHHWLVLYCVHVLEIVYVLSCW